MRRILAASFLAVVAFSLLGCPRAEDEKAIHFLILRVLLGASLGRWGRPLKSKFLSSQIIVDEDDAVLLG